MYVIYSNKLLPNLLSAVIQSLKVLSYFQLKKRFPHKEVLSYKEKVFQHFHCSGKVFSIRILSKTSDGSSVLYYLFLNL